MTMFVLVLDSAIALIEADDLSDIRDNEIPCCYRTIRSQAETSVPGLHST